MSSPSSLKGLFNNSPLSHANLSRFAHTIFISSLSFWRIYAFVKYGTSKPKNLYFPYLYYYNFVIILFLLSVF